MRPIFAAGVAACLMLSMPAFAGGAIAIDEDELKADRVSFGNAFNASATEAARLALEKCQTPRCKVVIKFTDRCGSLALAKKQFGVGSGPTSGAATAAALENCGSADCAVRFAECE